MEQVLRKLYGDDSVQYVELFKIFPLRPIKTEQELDDATEVIHDLVDLESRTNAQEDYLGVLTLLVGEYEDVHYSMEDEV